MANTATLFCTDCNSFQEFDVKIDGNGEYVMTCPASDSFIKFPGDADLVALVAAHNASNGFVVRVDDDGNIIPTEEQQSQLEALAESESNPEE